VPSVKASAGTRSPATTILTDRVREFTDEAMQLAAGTDRLELENVRRGLDQPLRVLIAGRVSSGKSTLVNALLGRRVAPTGQTETTRVPAIFRYDDRERAEVVLRSGERRRLDFEDGALPREIGIASERVEALDVRLSLRNGVLDYMALIDTPGGDSATQPLANAAREQLDVRASGRGRRPMADAVLFVLTSELLESEVEVIRGFEQSSTGSTSAAATLGVLSRADLVGDAASSGEPLGPARALAEEHLLRCGGALSDVSPVIGLLAETAETGALTSEDLKALHSLTSLAPADLEQALWSHGAFQRRELPVAPSQRERLLALLDLFGIRDVVAMLRRLPPEERSGAQVRAHLRAQSGFAQIRDVLLQDFAGRADAIKARHAIDRISELLRDGRSWTGSARGELSERLDAMLSGPELYRLSVIEFWAQLRSGVIVLPHPLVTDLERMARGDTLSRRLGVENGDPGALRRAIVAANQRWSAFGIDVSPREAAVVSTMRMAYTLAFAEAVTQTQEERSS
jgi:energy-coupling factor transporter ATP-binding protein EcfA2